MVQIGSVDIEFLGHSGFLITNGKGRRMAVDPYNISQNIGKVDFVLITHSHYDHCSIKDIEKVVKKGTVIIVPPDVQSKITRFKEVDMQIVEVGDEIEFGNVRIETLPAYNVDKDYHPKEEGWMGYLIKLEEVVVYHAGDTDKIPEMKKLTGYGKHGNQFVALLPVSGKFVMTAEEAAEVASFISPDLAIPMHYGAGVAGSLKDAESFASLCRESGLRAEVLKKI